MILFRCMMVEFARTLWMVRTVDESAASSNTSLYSFDIAGELSGNGWEALGGI